MKSTEVIDKLFLELSQFSSATLNREIAADRELMNAKEQLSEARADALRMAKKYKAIGKVNFMSEYEQVKASCYKEANEIIAKYEEE